MQQQSDSLDCVFANQFSLGWVTLDLVLAAAWSSLGFFIANLELLAQYF